MIFQNCNPKYDFGVDFEPTPPQNRSQNHACGGVAPAACMVLRRGWLKIDSKIIFGVKILKNHDFGLLEILFSCTTGDNLISTPPLSGRHNKCGGRNYSGRFQIFRICTPQLSRHKDILQFSSATIPFLDTKIHKDFPLENTHF